MTPVDSAEHPIYTSLLTLVPKMLPAHSRVPGGEQLEWFKVVVCGSRHFADADAVAAALGALYQVSNNTGRTLTVASGGARGADSLAQTWCAAHNVPFRQFRADWNTHGRAAGPIRNREMLAAKPDFVLGLHYDISDGAGTQDMLKVAKKAGVPVVLVSGPDRVVSEEYDMFVPLVRKNSSHYR